MKYILVLTLMMTACSNLNGQEDPKIATALAREKCYADGGWQFVASSKIEFPSFCVFERVK